ncbi:MAG TPA: HlyD family type I secretion periplasmic adaptor subunit [Geminicoccaceae bacterium]|nr:HlyD family type I secretion periplasmic adaptor subunit [Geminicoccaceae bacterium]
MAPGRLLRARHPDAEFVTGRGAAAFQGPRFFAHLLLIAVVAFFVVAFAWASWATVDEVTRGEGKVIPSRHVQVIQNLEGGIVAEILTREGAIVERGDALLRIENVMAASDLRELRSRYHSLLAAVGRLRAEVDETAVSFPPELLAEAREVAENEQALFNARQDELQTQLEILRGQAEQQEQQLTELRFKIEQLERSHQLAAEELALTEPLARQRIVPKVDLLRLQRQVHELKAELEASRLAVPRVESALREANRRIQEAFLTFRATSLRELNALRAELAGVAARIAAGEDRVTRTEVRSPVRGTIKRLLVNTVGGVIQPGADLVEIVPLEDTLLVEARVRPSDIAFLHPGLPAQVKITAYDFSIYGGLEAEVEDISADTILDERGQESFFRVRVRTAKNHLGTDEHPLPIIPGMTTQVDIMTGDKTVLHYLMKPILRARERALRER